MPDPVPRVLVADASLPNRRLIRELLTAFRQCEIDDAASAEHAFERAVQREYSLFLFAIALPDASGILLDRFLAMVYPKVHGNVITAPPVVCLTRSEDTAAYREVQSHARVRGAVPLPLNLDMLMNVVGAHLPAKEGGRPG